MEFHSRFFFFFQVQTDVVKQPSGVDVDYNRLAEWLSGIAPQVLEELDKSQRSHAFDDYEPGSGDSKAALKLLYTLVPPQPEFEVSGQNCVKGV